VEEADAEIETGLSLGMRSGKGGGEGGNCTLPLDEQPDVEAGSNVSDCISLSLSLSFSYSH